MRLFNRWIVAAGLMLALLGIQHSAVAAPVNAKQISADAKWYIHLDMDAAKQTVVYVQALEAVKEKVPLDQMIPQIRAVLGIDPLADITAVTVYNTSFEKDVAAILIYAKFDKQLLVNAVSNNPEYATEEYNGHTIHSWTDRKDGKHKVCCIVDDGLLLMGDKLETVKMALDVIDGKKPGEPAIIKTPPAGTFLSAAALLGQSPDANLAAILSDSQAVTASASEADGKVTVALQVTAKSAEQADRLAKIAEGARAFATIAGRQMPTLIQMLGEVKIATDGPKAMASIHHDSKTLIDDLRKLQQENQDRIAAAAASK